MALAEASLRPINPAVYFGYHTMRQLSQNHHMQGNYQSHAFKGSRVGLPIVMKTREGDGGHLVYQ